MGDALTDQQCAEIAAESKRREYLYWHPPRIVVEYDRVPGQPTWTEDTLLAHPEDYLALQRWADRQALLSLVYD